MRELTTRSGRRPSQLPEELFAFTDLLRARGVTSYLEVGARHGDTFNTVMRSLPTGARGVAVDLGGGPWGTLKSVRALEDTVRALRLDGYDADVVFGDSTSEEVTSAVAAMAPFDAVFIDGDHRYDGVAADWNNYARMGKIIAFHDIAGDGMADRAGNPVEVPRLWAEIRAVCNTVEFIAPASAMGIGVVLP